MVSWWPHLGMHASNGLDLQGLLYIDYIFHLPLEVAGVVLAYSFFSLLRDRMSSERPVAAGPLAMPKETSSIASPSSKPAR